MNPSVKAPTKITLHGAISDVILTDPVSTNHSDSAAVGVIYSSPRCEGQPLVTGGPPVKATSVCHLTILLKYKLTIEELKQWNNIGLRVACLLIRTQIHQRSRKLEAGRQLKSRNKSWWSEATEAWLGHGWGRVGIWFGHILGMVELHGSGRAGAQSGYGWSIAKSRLGHGWSLDFSTLWAPINSVALLSLTGSNLFNFKSKH